MCQELALEWGLKVKFWTGLSNLFEGQGEMETVVTRKTPEIYLS